MARDDREQVIADERALEARYKAELKGHNDGIAAGVVSQLPNTMTANVNLEFNSDGEIYGRVALANTEMLLEGNNNFYVGKVSYIPGHGEFAVINWENEAAGVFYQKPSCKHDWLNSVVARRQFARDRDGIVDFEDLLAAGQSKEDVFSPIKLVIPKAPKSNVTLPPAQDAIDEEDGEDSKPLQPPEPSSEAETNNIAKQPTPPESSIRAPELMQRLLARAKREKMLTAIGTLQPDQYEIVTLPGSDDVFVQGHPGTGKTIIAVHRAAYLLSKFSPEKNRIKTGTKVLVLGPTIEYAAHIGPALRELIEDQEQVHSYPIPNLLDTFARLTKSAEPTNLEDWRDVDRQLARLVDYAYTLTAAENGAASASASDVYLNLRSLPQNPPREGLAKEWADYLRSLAPTIEELRLDGQLRHRGLLAYIGVRTLKRSESFGQIGHIIVDEAQDLHPIEWEVLGRIGNLGGWTIVGDLNQRRNLFTFSSWDDVAELLAIEGENGAPLQVLENGYRSTQAIINYASAVLPRNQRHISSIQQGGEEPRRIRVSTQKKLVIDAVDEAIEQLTRVTNGTVAIITMDPAAIVAYLRSQLWVSKRGNPAMFTKASSALLVYAPEKARGLEFDAVTVVEPAAFPENLGQQGVLFTSLTRANRFLSIVYNRAMPTGLRP
jgi:DNA helicase IV